MATPPRDELLDHDYDGIQEYDNPVPQWMNVVFLVTVFFSLGYGWYYHLGGPGKSVAEVYAEEAATHRSEQAEVAAQHEVSEERLAALVQDPAAVAAGKAKFEQVCVACHGAKGEGKIGPNLTDDYWLYGGELMQIRHTILEGTPKGMPPLGKGMPPDELDEVVAFIGSIRGTNVPGKAPQGEKFALGGAVEEADGGEADAGASMDAAPPEAAPAPEAGPGR